MNRRAPSRCMAMPLSRAKAEMRLASSQSNIWPERRLMGLSMTMAPTSVATRPPAVRVMHGFDVGLRERGAARRQRHQRQAGERLARVAGVVVDVARLRHDHPAFRSGQRSQRELIREGARRHEHRRLLAEQRRPVLLERLHLTTQQVVVVFDVLVLAQPIEQRRVLARRDANAVAGSVDHAIGLDRRAGEYRRVREATGADGHADRPHKSAAGDGIHDYVNII